MSLALTPLQAPFMVLLRERSLLLRDDTAQMYVRCRLFLHVCRKTGTHSAGACKAGREKERKKENSQRLLCLRQDGRSSSSFSPPCCCWPRACVRALFVCKGHSPLAIYREWEEGEKEDVETQEGLSEWTDEHARRRENAYHDGRTPMATVYT